MENPYDRLKLDRQLCFPLYACAKEVIRKYKPYLDELDLTYTQYLVMMVLWEETQVNVKHLGEVLYLDSGTLTPVLKALEKKGYVTRTRAKTDERMLLVTITDAGMVLRERAVDIPQKMGSCMALTPKEATTLYRILYRLLGGSKSEETKRE